MGRKKRNRAQLKPFCFYCDREFDDEKVLIQHQKAKHFKCSECNRKLDTATGLVVHMLQVHKETISRVPNANNGRDNPDLIIHGMDGVPMELIAEKQAKLDEERGAVRHSKSAHTTFGMSVMSGFLNQMSGVQGQQLQGLPPMMHPQLAAAFGPSGQPNPFAFNQFVAQMQQGPQAAFTAMFGVPAPKPEPPPMMPSGISTAPSLPSPTASPPPAGAATIGGPATQPPFPATGRVSAPGGGFSGPSGFSSITIPTAPAQPASAGDASGRLAGALSSTLAFKTGRLMFDPADDTISPEEIRAQRPQYKTLVA